jgi:hypothetical protein
MRAILAAVAATALYISGTNGMQQYTNKHLRPRQLAAAKHLHLHTHPVLKTSTGAVKNITFSNPKASGSFLSPYWAHMRVPSGISKVNMVLLQIFMWMGPASPT